MFSGIDLIAIIVVTCFILYLANPGTGNVEFKIEPLALVIVLVTILMFVLTL